MKRIVYEPPVDYMAGNLCGRQDLLYQDGKRAYEGTTNTKNSATNYQPRLIARYHKRTQIKCFQVRTKTTTNLTNAMRHSMALMGGTGALYSALVNDKTSDIYLGCLAACPRKQTLRSFVTPIIRAGLAAKDATIVIANGVAIVNPWISSAEPNVPVSAQIISKFASELSNITTPYDAATTAYLQSTYPDYWNSISQYGFDNPAMVPLIEEDNDVICSLLNVGVTRFLVSDGSAYIVTGYYPKDYTQTYTQVYMSETTNFAPYGVIGGWVYGWNYTSIYSNYNDDVSTNKDVSSYIGRVFYAVQNKNLAYLDGELVVTHPVSTFSVGAPLVVFRNNDHMFKGRIARVTIKENDVDVCDFVPFVRNSVKGMIDIVSGQFFQNAGGGAFDITKINN